MNWLEEWAKLEVIGRWIGIGLAALIALAFVVWLAIFLIKWEYKKHSKKYVWDCSKGNYVKKEDHCK